MEIKIMYDGRGILNEVTQEEIQEHLVVKKGVLRVWHNKREYYTLYKIRYHKLHEKPSNADKWNETNAIQMHKFSTLEFL